jgi:transposase
MITLRDGIEIHFSLFPVDMRKSIDGLSGLVVDLLEQSPQSGHLFVFYNRARDKVKILYWDKNGFVMHYKRLEKGRFKLNGLEKDGSILLNENQLQWLLAGLDFRVMETFSHLSYENYY